MSKERFVFNSLPKTVAELQSLPEATLDSPYKTVALTMVALCRYTESVEDGIAMLDWLKGPEAVSPFEQQFIRERLSGKAYKVFSFFEGATPENEYKPNEPFAITISDNPYSFKDENWGTLYVTSGGADNPRTIRLRKKPSTGQWFLNEIQCLADIRVPVAQDPWA